jgi:hypothetical protein
MGYGYEPALAIVFTVPLCLASIAGGVWVSVANRKTSPLVVTLQLATMATGAALAALEHSIGATIVGAVQEPRCEAIWRPCWETIAVTRGSMQDQELQDLAPGATIQRFEDNNSTIASFLSGQATMFAAGTAVAATIKQRNPNLDLELKTCSG